MTYNKYNHEIIIPSIYLKKTVLGSLAFFLSSFLISLVLLAIFRQIFDFRTMILALIVTISSTLAEFLSPLGLDTISIPLAVILVLIFLF